jgi:membrane-bound serine protease (ClpP class)
MMDHYKKRVIFFSTVFLCAGSFLLSLPSSHAVSSNRIRMIQLNDDTINPVTADYIVQAIDRAEQEKAQCLIIKMDTPGGLLNSTRMIVKKMLTAKVPVVVYIAPSGSRAGSAGVFITYASHIAAMAPSTNIGAAHPVQVGDGISRKTGEWRELKQMIDDLKEAERLRGRETLQEGEEEAGDKTEGMAPPEEEIKADENPMESKILQDTVAFVKAIAKERNRNIDWGVDSVVKSASITSEEALAKGVVELIANSDEDLLQQLDGRVVAIDDRQITLQTKDAPVELIEMDQRQKFFNILANPNIAYMLLILGFYGLLFEVTHPGFGAPGILGIIFLILAFYSMQTLPTNYAGLALLVFGIILLIAEAFTPTFGVLTLGGLACMILGSMLLFESTDPVMRVSRSAIFAFSLTTAGITLFLMRSVLRAHRAKVQGGQEGLIGMVGEAKTDFTPGKKGKVFVHGELWNADSDERIQEGDEIIVEKVEGLTVKIKKK